MTLSTFVTETKQCQVKSERDWSPGTSIKFITR